MLASAVLTLGTLVATPAWADDSATLTVVGTSDVFDSNLVQNVIKPGFEKAFAQYTLNYVSKGTGAAIAYAEAGTASALVVHAASLENQFVGQGYSLEPYGRAIFYGDYVLVGPSGDPASVAANAPDDVVSAFERVASAGAAGTANFVSRGGTPGTTVQEHAIWARTTGVMTCDVSAANGGGASPSTSTGPCPSSIPYPSWYHATGLTQAPNIENADSCNYSGGGCYVLTDRGTFDYLTSTNAVSNLKIVTQASPTTTADKANLLVNSFHAYAVNPAKFSGNAAAGINRVAATAFLNWITSPPAQAAVGAYLSSGGRPPFLPDAAPALSAGAIPRAVVAGTSVSVTGRLANVAPNTPPLANQPVTLLARAAQDGASTAVASTTTDAAGGFRFTVTPTRSATYTLSTGRLAQVEDASLSPSFADLLAPSSLALGPIAVIARPGPPALTALSGGVRLRAALVPVTSGARGFVSIYGAVVNHSLHLIKQGYVPAGATRVDATVAGLARNVPYTFQIRYAGTAGQFSLGSSPVRMVRTR
ncbi:MAG: hypothetical protein NVS3B26_07290 [Mycobacteriales bacterium]